MGTVFHFLPITAASQAGSWITAAIIAAIIIILAIRNIRIVPQAANFIIERPDFYSLAL